MFALGFVSVFDQITEGLPGDGPADIFNSYMAALQEDPEQYRKYGSRFPHRTELYYTCKFLLTPHFQVVLYS